MRTLFLDCSMGAAGDMLAAALLELTPDREAALAELNAIGVPGVRFFAEPSVKCGIVGTHMRVTVHGKEEAEPAQEHAHPSSHVHEHEHVHEHDHDHGHDPEHGRAHHHSHTGIEEIRHLVGAHLQLPEPVREDVLAVYTLLAEAESRVHGVPVPEIHFHEVGTLDAVADIAAVCLLMRRLAPERVVVSPVHVGSGQVRCAHGLLPVPAPATAWLLREVPICGGAIRGELCTPTGAALLRHFADEFGALPAMRVQRIGYGMGTKDFEAANCVRAMLGETELRRDQVCILACNLDDMTGEAVGFATDRLFEAGALDVYTVGIGMKKSRPGLLLRVLCRPEDRRRIAETIFRHTSTLGIRELTAERYTLDRETRRVDTPYGPVRKKLASGFGVRRSKYEYEDLAGIARREGISLAELLSELEGEDGRRQN